MLGSELCSVFYLIPGFPSLKLGTRDFKAKSGRDSGFKVCAGDGTPKITFGVTDPWVYRSGLQGLFGDPLISHLKLLTML